MPHGSWVLDPFGASPRLAVEAAQAGYRVLVAANNPIARFLLELHADPPTEGLLRSALADLAASQKAGERIEPHIRSLYLTNCNHCGVKVEAKAFIWEREGSGPSSRIYECPACKEGGEEPVSPGDVERASRFASSGLHWARALERVTPLDDPDRQHVEEALSMYLPRTVYALFTLINKLESFPPGQRRSLEALLLAAFDQTNVMWAHPIKRARPRQLNVPTRFREVNVWLALEEAIEAWAGSIPATKSINPTLTTWPDELPSEGGICIFEGRLRDIAEQLRDQPQPCSHIDAVLAAIPRPNQAYWTLSALWAGWLWGHEASAPFKSVLRRRRYDWTWHTVALQAAYRHLVTVLEPGTPYLGLIGELETGFLSAAILSAEMAGMDLFGIALRDESDQAQIHWRRADESSPPLVEVPDLSEGALQESCQRAAQHYLRQRGEPASYLYVHAAALSELAQAYRLAPSSETSPAELLRDAEDALKSAFSYRGGFSRYGGSSRLGGPRSMEVGQWWLDPSIEETAGTEITLSLADRVEMEVVRYLGDHPGCTLDEVDRSLCGAFKGLLTPDLELIQACLDSYGEYDPGEYSHERNGGWKLRDQDKPLARRADLVMMRRLLEEIGTRLGYRVVGPEREGTSGRDLKRTPILWREADGSTAYTFYLLASGVLGNVVFGTQTPRRFDAESLPDQMPPNLIVIPGGRAGLVMYKTRQNLRLQSAIKANWRFLKFRHLRWLAENETLSRHNLDEQLDLDPLANRDPQMQLL